jgi:hypothetical protein
MNAAQPVEQGIKAVCDTSNVLWQLGDVIIWKCHSSKPHVNPSVGNFPAL